MQVTISGGLIDTDGIAYEFEGLPETIIRGEARSYVRCQCHLVGEAPIP